MPAGNQYKSLARKYRHELSMGKRFRHWRPVKWLRKFAFRDPFDFEKWRLYWTVIPYTMCMYDRLNNAYELAVAAEKAGLPGAFVECGVYKGGCAAVMAYAANKFESGRKTWLFDSFEGLPEPTGEDGTEATVFAHGKASGKLSSIERCVGPLDDAEEILFGKLKLERTQVEIVKGWFQDTLPDAALSVGPIAILRLDGDWYESTKCCLVNLYDNVVPGGYVILDDYGRWEGCRIAFDEFIEERGSIIELRRIDDAGVYFKKP